MPTRRTFLASAAAASLSSLLPRTSSAASTTAPLLPNTLLFLDDHHILYTAGTRRTLQPLTRHNNNPLIPGSHSPWARDIAYCSVHHDRRTGKYQLWYQAYAGSTARDRTRRCTVCYAESDDGLTWMLPKLNLFDFDGARDTNIVLIANGGHSDRYGASVIIDPRGRDPDPSRLYKMAYFDFSRDPSAKEFPGLCAAFSEDGIHWTKHPTGPLLPVSYGKTQQPPFSDEAESQPWSIPLSISDAFDAMFDPISDTFALYGKMWIDGPDGAMYGKHAVGRTTSKDFLNWSGPQLIMTPDEHDPPWAEFHTTPVFYYQGVYFACPQILNRNENNGVMDVELAISRDGVNFTRPFRKPFFLPRGAPDSFDSGSVFTNASPVVLDNEIRFYYGGYSQGATGTSEFAPKSGIGLATLPLDRFASISPLDKIAQITLRPIDLTNVRSLTLNADASRGRIRVELLDANARRLRNYTREDADPITTDSLRHAITWKNKPALPHQPCMIRIHLEEAQVFALTLARA